MVGNEVIITDYDWVWKDLIQEFFEDFLLLLASGSLLFQYIKSWNINSGVECVRRSKTVNPCSSPRISRF